MPMITFDGQTHRIPGVYHKETVVQQGAGPLPDWMVPVVLSGADQGYPYDVNGKLYPQEGARPIFDLVKTTGASSVLSGAESEMAAAFAIARRHGLPQGYCICLSPLTRATVIATSTGPVSEFTLYAESFGFLGGHIKVSVATGALTITPVKRYARLTADAATGATRLYLKDNGWLKIGSTYEIGANNVSNAAITILDKGSESDANGQIAYWVTLTAGLAGGVTAAQYAVIVEYAATQKEESGTLTTGDQIVDWLNGSASTLLGAKKEATFSGAVPINVPEAPLKEIAAWTTVTVGTSPDPTSSDYAALVTLMDDSGWDDFMLQTGKVPQAFLLVDSSSTVHATMRDWAIAKRGEGYPISITTGCDWGDTDMSAANDTNPTFRANVLNSQDILLMAGGLDYQAAYRSLAPAAYGRRVGGGVNHNLTNDDLFYEAIEYPWKERTAGELTALLAGGVSTYSLSVHQAIRYRLVQGLSTLQTNDQSWNEVTNDSPLVHQRDLADFVLFTLGRDLDQFAVGTDGIAKEGVKAICVRRATQLLKRGYITSWGIESISLNATGAGWDVIWSIKLPVTTDYITLHTQIVIGED